LIASSQIISRQTKDLLVFALVQVRRHYTLPSKTWPQTKSRAPLSVLLLCVRAAGCVPRRPASLCVRDIIVCEVSQSWKTICSPSARISIPRAASAFVPLTHTRSYFIPLSLSSLSQIVKQVASPPFVFSSSQSVFLLSVLIIVAILERSLFSGESTYLPW
jgi:hypothetical protein